MNRFLRIFSGVICLFLFSYTWANNVEKELSSLLRESLLTYDVIQGDGEAKVFFKVADNDPKEIIIYYSLLNNGQYGKAHMIRKIYMVDKIHDVFVAPNDDISTLNDLYIIILDTTDYREATYSLYNLAIYPSSWKDDEYQLSIEYFPKDINNPNFVDCFKNISGYSCDQKGVEKYTYDLCKESSYCLNNKHVFLNDETFFMYKNTPYRFEGEIGDYNIRMTLYNHSQDTNIVTGSYFYLDENGFSRGDIELKGKINGNKVTLFEYSAGKMTGDFMLELVDDENINGFWNSNDNRTLLLVKLARY